MGTTDHYAYEMVTSDSVTSLNVKLNFCLTGVISEHVLIVQPYSRVIINLWLKLTAIHSGIYSLLGQG